MKKRKKPLQTQRTSSPRMAPGTPNTRSGEGVVDGRAPDEDDAVEAVSWSLPSLSKIRSWARSLAGW